MNKYLYFFGYETPQQFTANREHGWDDEDSHAVFVIASSESEALRWGREISETFVAKLFRDGAVSWKQLNYAHGIETNPEERYSSAELQNIPVVQVGQLPTLLAMPPDGN
jgi:hypothetical protein